MSSEFGNGIARVRTRKPQRWTAVWTASVYIIGGHFQEVVPSDCPDDGAAKEQAKQLVDRGEQHSQSPVSNANVGTPPRTLIAGKGQNVRL
jgi:hypothetical protein